MKTQNETILKHLQTKPLTALQAIEAYGVLRLASRINELKLAGHAINSEMVQVPNRNGELCRVARYSLGATV